MTTGEPEDQDETDSELDDAMQTLIGQQLKAMYDEVVAEPIPPRLLSLLEQLDAVTQKKPGEGS